MPKRQRGKRKIADLDKGEVKALRRRYAKGGVSQRELADEYGLTLHQVGRITRGDARPEDGGPVGRRPTNKLTRRQVATLRRRYAAGTVNQATLAREHDLSAGAISRLLSGITYAHVGGPRTPKGGMPHGHKLTPKQILDVVRSDEGMSALARKHGVTRQAIQQLRRRWKARLAERDGEQE